MLEKNPSRSSAQRSKMEQVYSVGVTNRYALFLDDEDDPGDVVLAPSVKPDRSDKDKKKPLEKAPKGKGKENKDKIQQASKKAAVESSGKSE